MMGLFLKRMFKDGDNPTKEQLTAFSDTWKNHWSQYILRFGDLLRFASISTPLAMAEQCWDHGTPISSFRYVTR